MTTNRYDTLEGRVFREYMERSGDERDFAEWIASARDLPGLLVAQGFEERSLGLLRRLAQARVRLPGIVIGRYTGDEPLNVKYQGQFEEFAEAVSPGHWRVIPNQNDGAWVTTGANLIDAPSILLDVSGLSTRGIFGALDAASRSKRRVLIGYTEADEYWPKKSAWEQMKKDLLESSNLPETVDKKPWLFGYEHRVDFVPGHEGYDSAGSGIALIAFLPFKCARLGAVAGEEDYSQFLFIAGRPRLEKNQWRLEALKDINTPVIREHAPIEMSTFEYRKALDGLASHLLGGERLLEKYDIRLAVLGSKMQTVACWILSCIVPSITCIVSVPTKYYEDAFSEGMGCTWVFELTIP